MEKSMTRLVFSPANQAYMFVFGKSPLRLRDNDMFFNTRKAALRAAKECGLSVKRNGEVHPL